MSVNHSLDPEIRRLTDELAGEVADDFRRAEIINQIKALSTIRNADLLNDSELHNSVKKRGVSPDTVLIVAANIAGIIAILAYEHAHPIVSKALGFILKARN